MVHSLSAFWQVIIFAAGAAAVLLCGVPLARASDVLSDRLGIGESLGGELFLAFSTNLPEIAIVVTAAVAGTLGIAVGNILGGIAIQTVVLAVMDGVAVHGKPLTYRGSALVEVVQGCILIAILALAVMGTRLSSRLILFRLTPIELGIVAVWLFGMWVARISKRDLPWRPYGVGQADETCDDISRKQRRKFRKAESAPVWRAWVTFAVTSLVTLVAGTALELTSTELASRVGMTSVVFAATVLAAVTALPEVTTGIAAIRLGAYEMAFSDIFGGNAFLPVLFVLASLISGKAVLPQARGSDLYLTALAMLLTAVYMIGILFRPKRQFLRLGPDSWAVLVAYGLGVAGLVFVR